MKVIKNKISLSILSLAFGFIILFFSNGYFSSSIVPGPISASHSSFSEDCVKCHDSDFKTLPINILHSNKEKCNSCHNIKNHVDAKITKTSCTECHQEHKGNSKLNFDNDKCQSCHIKKFDSFENGHPPFSSYPYEKRTHIIYSHQAHQTKYFSSKNITCNTCHYVDEKGEHMRLNDFKASCAECHLKEVNGEGQSQTGFAFISMPQIDYQTLGINNWTADGELTNFVKEILATDPVTKENLEKIKDLNLSDLSQATDEQKLAAKKVISDLKNFYLELYAQGHSALKSRLQKIQGAEVDNLISGFPLSMFRKALKDWLPGVIKKTADSEEEVTSEELMQSGGWYRNTYTIFYRPRGHADVFSKAWMDLPDSEELKKEILAPSAPGRCGYCHSIDFNKTVNWRADYRSSNLVHFKHESHFLVMKGCTACHGLNPEYVSEYSQEDPHKFKSNFLDIEKKLCKDCHSKDKAKNNCLECHSYHSK